MDKIIPDQKLLSRTERDTKERQTPLSEKTRSCLKKTTKPKTRLQKKASKSAF